MPSKMVPSIQTTEIQGAVEGTIRLDDGGDGASVTVDTKIANASGPQMSGHVALMIAPKDLRMWADTFAALADKYDVER